LVKKTRSHATVPLNRAKRGDKEKERLGEKVLNWYSREHLLPKLRIMYYAASSGSVENENLLISSNRCVSAPPVLTM
jgi:hypothetical protein